MPNPRGGRPLDPERPAPDELPLGLRAQIGATRDSLRGLAQAHVDLAKAEASEIGGEVARAAGLGVVAFACALMLVFLVYIGLCLFLGAWLFGSMGWGVLHGSLLLIAIAVFAVMAALRVPGLGVALAAAFVIGLFVSILLGPALGNQLWTRIGEALDLQLDPEIRPLVVAVAAWTVAGAVIGLVVGYRRARTAGSAIVGLLVGAIVGLLVGAFSAITYSWQVGVAIGVAVGLVSWPVIMGWMAAREGIDQEGLKRRFTPQVTIDTAKETIEWAKARMPLGPQS